MIKNYIKKLWAMSVIRNILVLSTGTAGSQMLGVIFIPFVTRLYGPEVYGVLGGFLALIAVLSPISNLAYSGAIVLPKKDSAAQALVKISLAVAMLMSLLVFVILLTFGKWLFLKTGLSYMVGVMFFIPFMMFITACNDIAQQWLIRKKHFKAIANAGVAYSAAKGSAQIIGGSYIPSASMLVGTQLACFSLSVFWLARVGKRVAESSRSGFDLIKNTAYEYKNFPLYRAPQLGLNSISESLPILMLTSFFGPAAAGYYALTRTVLGLPSILLGRSVQSVFYPHFNEAFLENKKTFPWLIKSVSALALLGLLPFITIVLLGPYLFELVFGEEWQQAGQYAQWLSIWMFFNLIDRPVVAAVSVFNLQRWLLVFEIVSLICILISFYISFVYFNSAVVAIALFSIISALLSVFLIIKIFSTAINFDKLIK